MAGGKLTLKVTIKQNEEEPGIKLEMEGFLGTLHLLLSPSQLSLLREMAADLAQCQFSSFKVLTTYVMHCYLIAAGSNSSEQVGFEKLTPGQSRPIPREDRSTIESQLARHQQREHKAKAKLQERQDLLDADPWDNSITQTSALKSAGRSDLMTESIYSTSTDHFYSLDLNNTSLTSSAISGTLQDSFLSTASRLTEHQPQMRMEPGKGGTVHRRCLDEGNIKEAISLHEGVGLQQLSQSPPFQQQQLPPKSSKQHCLPPSSSSSSNQKFLPTCKYNLTLSGVTVALLEANPSHTYTTKLTETTNPTTPPSSVDEGGLDPVRYFELVSQILKDGINSHQLELWQKELAQSLPTDHLLLVG